jgi:prepilin-type N-terminal cleavage/methylation domain-containing protein
MKRQYKQGFTLIEVLVACTLLALVIIPLMRAMNANQKIADAIVNESASSISEASQNAEKDFLESAGN